MSIWRDIWKEAIIENKIAINNNNCENFEKLFTKYKDDGMVFYERGEAYEFLKQYDKALEDYKKAAELFPVQHWKDVSNFSSDRIQKNHYFQIVEQRAHAYETQWNAFHTMHTFCNLLDECRYLGISALSRIDSEPPLAIVNFRTAMELEIKFFYKEIVDSFGKDYCLSKVINSLADNNIDDWRTLRSMEVIRLAGNEAAHENKYEPEYLKKTINSFISVMEFFNEKNSRF